MYNLTFKDSPVHVKSDKVKIGDKIEFNLVAPNLEPLNSKDVKGKKVISVFPSINTKLCDVQTKEITLLAKKYKDYQFVSISLDLPFALGEWCAASDHENILIGSDYLKREFGSKYGFLIDEIQLLNRGVLVLDENDKVIYFQYVEEVTTQLDFDELSDYLSSINK